MTFIGAGYPHRPDWVSKELTKQEHKEAQARYRHDDTYKPNVFPRGRCAVKMMYLGWEFNENKSA